jgi:nucleoside-diphosphate-sugar epimerase
MKKRSSRQKNEIRHRVLLTGSSGTLGHHILLQLAEDPQVRVMALHRRHGIDLFRHPRVRHEVVNFTHKKHLASLIREFQPTCLIHCAADGMIFPQLQWFNLVRFNVDVTLSLFKLASSQPGCHFIHVSTGLAYRSTSAPLTETDALDNNHPYGASKASADILLRSAAVEFGVPLTVFRPFSFTGIRDNRTRLFPSILRAAAEGSPLALSAGDRIRDFCSARDIARGIVLAVDRPAPPQMPAVYNLGSGKSATLRHLITQTVEELGLPVQLGFGERPYGGFEPVHLLADISRARKELQWKPEHRLPHAVWQLARSSFPGLKLKEPKEFL